MINLIAAVGLYGEIGYKNTIPWLDDERIVNTTKADLAWFAKQTAGGILVVGGRTWQGMLDMGFQPGTRDVFVWKGEGVSKTLADLEASTNGLRDIWICGGAHTYRQFMPHVQRFYISRIPWTGKADAHMPPILPNQGYMGGPVHA